ncbi:MAG: hypothetical protein HY459_04165, partial [Parcubacteria group bacterium]|nr:hypothetical protein [Parcubacteria group bacterium]
MATINWGQSYTRPFSIHKLDVYFLNARLPLLRFFNHGIGNVFAVGSGREVTIYFDNQEFHRLGHSVLQRTLQDARRNKNHVYDMKQFAKRANSKLTKFNLIDFSKHSSKDLLQYFNTFASTVHASCPIIFAPITIENELFNHAKIIVQKGYQKKMFTLAWDTVVTPRFATPVTQLETDLHTILENYKPTAVGQNLRKIQRRYNWFNMRFIDSKPFSISQWEKQIDEIGHGNWKGKLAEFRRKQRQRQKRFGEILKPFSPPERRFLTLVNDYSALRHERDAVRGSSYYYGCFLYREIMRRYKITAHELGTFTMDDVRTLLRTGQPLPRQEVRRRRTEFIYSIMHGTRTVRTDYPQMREALQDQGLVKETSHTQKTIRGMTAFPGIVRGRARVISLNRLSESLHAVQR